MFVFVVTIDSMLFCANICAQHVQPEVGKPIPPYTLTDIHHFHKKQVPLDEFKGKWLFLDFWSPSCSNSTSSLRKVNNLQNQFKQQTSWMLVGANSSLLNPEIDVKNFFEQLRAKYKHQLPVAYDSVLIFRWDIPSFPVIYIVDPSGILRYITDGSDLTVEKIEKIIHNEPVRLYDIMKVYRSKEFDPNSISVADSAINRRLLHRSILMKWNGEQSDGGMPVDRWLTAGRKFQDRGYTFAGVPLYWLFNHAYRGRTYWSFDDPDYGKVLPMPIVETADSTLFDFNLNSGNGTYNYTLHVPASGTSSARIKTSMQNDLYVAFGLSATVERRNVRVWKVVAKPGAVEKLKTKGGKSFSSPGNHMLGFTIRNMPPQYLIGEISLFLLGKYLDPYIPFVDDTGLKDNFDLTLEADMLDMEDIKRALHKQGLDIVIGTREMEVLVIK